MSKSVKSIGLRMPPAVAQSKVSNPVFTLTFQQQAPFREIPGDVMGVLRAYCKIPKEVRLSFEWGFFRIYFSLETDVLYEKATGECEGTNVRFVVEEIKGRTTTSTPLLDEVDTSYGVGYAIKYMLEDLVKVEFQVAE